MSEDQNNTTTRVHEFKAAKYGIYCENGIINSEKRVMNSMESTAEKEKIRQK